MNKKTEKLSAKQIIELSKQNFDLTKEAHKKLKEHEGAFVSEDSVTIKIVKPPRFSR